MKILIVRLYPDQFYKVQERYKGPHKLDYLDSAADEGIARLQAKAAWADRIIVLTKFVSHKHWDNLPREKVVHASGISSVVDVLNAFPPDILGEPVKTVTHEPKVHIKRLHHEEENAPMSTSTTRKVGDFTLTTAVPPPTPWRGGNKPRNAVYPLDEMRVGESFFIECADKMKVVIQRRLSGATVHNTKKHPERHYTVSVREAGGVRCWRLPDRNPDEKRAKPGRKSKKNKSRDATMMAQMQ